MRKVEICPLSDDFFSFVSLQYVFQDLLFLSMPSNVVEKTCHGLQLVLKWLEFTYPARKNVVLSGTVDAKQPFRAVLSLEKSEQGAMKKLLVRGCLSPILKCITSLAELVNMVDIWHSVVP